MVKNSQKRVNVFKVWPLTLSSTDKIAVYDLKLIYSEKATKFCEIFPLLLSCVVPVKSKGKILQTFVTFSEYMNFNGAMLHNLDREKKLALHYQSK